ncbi:MAG TPA: glycosyltransferase [Miltoncostaeaceae bacterium]|nr:glycosyltransferase [Miltoncostaeaceae bacterium]
MIAERLRVLTLIDLLEGAGAERTAVELAIRLDRDRFEPMVCATRSPECEATARLRAAGVPVMRLGRTSPVGVHAWAPLMRLLRAGSVDVLHAHKFGSNAWGTLLGRLTRVPVVIATEHTWAYKGQPVRKLADHLIGRSAAAFVAVSELDRRRMVAFERVPFGKTRVIPTGLVPHRHEDGEQGDLRTELGIPPDAPVIGTVCAIRTQKRLDVLLDAFTIVRRRHADARLIIVGDGPGFADLQHDVAARGAGDAVALLGRREDVPVLLRALDVFAISSDFEGTPLSLLEAMAAERPVVSTGVGGIPDVLGRDGACGILVPPGDPAALADGLRVVLEDPGLGRRLGAAAAQRVGDEYDFDRVVQRWQDLYVELSRGRVPDKRVATGV